MVVILYVLICDYTMAIKKAVDSKDSKLLTKAMAENMVALDKNEA